MANTIKTLLKNLSYMVYEKDYYEEDLANYILGRLDKEDIKNTLDYAMGSSLYNFNVNVNLWSYINITHNPIFIDIGTEDAYVSLANSQNNQSRNRIKHSEIEDSKNKRQDVINQWSTLLSKKSPELTKNIDIYIKPLGINSIKDEIVKTPINLMDYYALSDLESWFLYNKTTDKFSEHGKILIAYDLFSTGQSYTFNNIKHKIKNYPNEINFIFNIMAENKNKIISYLLAEKDNQDKPAEYVWLNGLFNGSDNMKLLLKNASIENIKSLFSGEPISTVIKVFTLKDNIDNVKVYNEVLKLYNPEEIIAKYTKDKKFNIASYFNARFKNTFGSSLVSDDTKNVGYRSSYSSKITYNPDNVKSLCEEMEYLKDAIKSSNIDEKMSISFWTKVIKTNELDIIKTVHKVLELPSREETVFYEMYDKAHVRGKFMEEIRSEVLSEHLNEILPTTELSVKKVKI